MNCQTLFATTPLDPLATGFVQVIKRLDVLVRRIAWVMGPLGRSLVYSKDGLPKTYMVRNGTDGYALVPVYSRGYAYLGRNAPIDGATI